MKNFFIYIALACGLSSASCTNLDEVNERLDKIETIIIEPKLLGMEFRAEDNPQVLIEDAVCNIIGDSVVDCWVRNIMENKELVAHFEFEGDEVTINDEILTSDITRFDYKVPARMEIKAGEQTKEYTVTVHSFTGLPILWIETEKRAEVVSRDNYLKAHFRLVEDAVTRSAGDIVETDGQIKGRGNTTWTMMPKKPYRLKFSDKVSFLDEPKDKAWVLLANYTDKTSLRNATAFYMGSISNLEYTPKFHFVDVMLNGRYNGTYQLGDKLKISKNRVNVGDDGFLMEIDFRAPDESDARIFNIAHLPSPVNIKDPEVEYDDENYTYIKEFITMVDKILYSDNFTDPAEGWQKYMDMDSFVDWYLINEIARNNDASFHTSCYMNLKRGDKLKMGPIWDFDIAFGNINYNGNYSPEGFWIKGHTTWYDRLFKDPAFVAKVKERFTYFYDHRSDILENINANARYIRYSIEENENRWHTLYTETWPNYDIWGSYANEVQALKTWLTRRFEWLNTEFDKM